MTELLLALMTTLSLSVAHPVDPTPSISTPHAAHVRRMLQSDGLEALIDSNIPELQTSLKRAVAKKRGEPNLTTEETERFETVSRPVFNRLKQQLLDYAVQDYAALSDPDIDALIGANETPLARRFIAVMARSEMIERPTLATYLMAAANGITEAYTKDRPYSPKYGEATGTNDSSPENRLLILTGNAAMCDEAIQNYFPAVVVRQITEIDFEKLSDADSARLRSLFLAGMEDLGDRLKALKRSELRSSFSKDELDQLIALYSFPAVQTKIHIAQTTIVEARTRNGSAIKTAFDEVSEAFPVTAGLN